MDECVGNEVAELDTQLSQELSKEGADYGAAAVGAVQAEWTKFRDSQCTLEANFYKGGTIQPMIYGECVIALTEQRLQEVRNALAEQPHGGP